VQHLVREKWQAAGPQTLKGQIDQLKASGFLNATDLTVADLISRYQRELYPVKQGLRARREICAPWPSRSAPDPVSTLDPFHVFTDTHAKGARRQRHATRGVAVGLWLSRN
jgi:hypothetical protein